MATGRRLWGADLEAGNAGEGGGRTLGEGKRLRGQEEGERRNAGGRRLWSRGVGVPGSWATGEGTERGELLMDRGGSLQVGVESRGTGEGRGRVGQVEGLDPSLFSVEVGEGGRRGPQASVWGDWGLCRGWRMSRQRRPLEIEGVPL